MPHDPQDILAAMVDPETTPELAEVLAEMVDEDDDQEPDDDTTPVNQEAAERNYQRHLEWVREQYRGSKPPPNA